MAIKKFRFLEWQVYQDAQELFSFILNVVEKLPKKYRYELGSQLVRSNFSVVLNIAEGSGKISDAELNRFLDIALGSAYETLAASDTLIRNKLISQKDFEFIQQEVSGICDQLGGFKRKIKTINNN